MRSVRWCVRMTKQRLLFSGFGWDHHDENAGYHHVVAAAEDYVDGGKLWGSRGALGSLPRKINFLLIDLMTILRSFRYSAVLVFYPEQTGFLSAPLLKLFGKRVVYTLHLGEDYWFHRNNSVFLRLKRFNLRFVSRFIVLTEQQKLVFGKHLRAPIKAIPHGMRLHSPDCEPAAAPAVGEQICVIGDTYRDYALLARIIVAINQRFPAMSIHLIGMKYDKLNGAQHSRNVVCHPRLSRQAYQDVLSNSRLLVLPLTFSTANNALLEGLACGIPVVTNDVVGVLEYLPGPEYVFSSVDHLCALIGQRLAQSAPERIAEADRLRGYVAHRYAWDTVQRQVTDYCLEGIR